MEKTEDGAAKPLEEIKETVTAAWKQPKAVHTAAKDASQLTVDIYDAYTAKQIPVGDEAALLDFVKGAGYTIESTPAFNPQGQLPQDFPLPANAAQAAAKLNDRRLYSDAISGPESAYVVFRGEQTPAKMPKLDDVRDRVVSDYTAVETNRAFTDFGKQIHEQLQQGVDNGGSFSAIAKKNGFTAKSFNDFTIMDTPKGLPQYYFYQLMDMKQAKSPPCSALAPTRSSSTFPKSRSPTSPPARKTSRKPSKRSATTTPGPPPRASSATSSPSATRWPPRKSSKRATPFSMKPKVLILAVGALGFSVAGFWLGARWQARKTNTYAQQILGWSDQEAEDYRILARSLDLDLSPQGIAEFQGKVQRLNEAAMTEFERNSVSSTCAS